MIHIKIHLKFKINMRFLIHSSLFEDVKNPSTFQKLHPPPYHQKLIIFIVPLIVFLEVILFQGATKHDFLPLDACQNSSVSVYTDGGDW